MVSLGEGIIGILKRLTFGVLLVHLMRNGGTESSYSQVAPVRQ
jgi:hypothetical protein